MIEKMTTTSLSHHIHTQRERARESLKSSQIDIKSVHVCMVRVREREKRDWKTTEKLNRQTKSLSPDTHTHTWHNQNVLKN